MNAGSVIDPAGPVSYISANAHAPVGQRNALPYGPVLGRQNERDSDLTDRFALEAQQMKG